MKNKIYLIWSCVILLLTFIAVLENYQVISLFGLSFEIIWLPIFFSICILPLLNIAEIVINKNDNNMIYWISIVLNIITILFVLRHFEIDLF